MKNFCFILSFILLLSCGKPKTVLICGDHICVNKKEAEIYFQENLSIEVKIIDDRKKDLDLVELNLRNSRDDENREIFIKEKSETKKQIKTLTNNEIKSIKEKIKKKEKNIKIAKKKDIKLDQNENDKISNNKIPILNNKNNKVVDVCTLIEKCSIDEISKYLTKEGNKKGYPDISIKK